MNIKKIKYKPGPDPARSKTQNITSLLRYMVTGGKRNGQAEKTEWWEARNFVCDTQHFPSVVGEMLALSTANTRSHHTISHYIFSWPTGEIPTKEKVNNAVQITLDQLGLRNCQYVLAAHGNTGNFHVHMCVNRVDIDTEKTVKPGGGWEVKNLHKSIARYNAIYHADPTTCPDSPVYVFNNNSFTTTQHNKLSMPQGAQDMEKHTGELSLISQWRIQKNTLQAATTWQGFHRACMDLGGKYERLGKGKSFGGRIRISLKDDKQITIRPSKIGADFAFKKLELRLGTFEPYSVEKEQAERLALKQRRNEELALKREQEKLGHVVQDRVQTVQDIQDIQPIQKPIQMDVDFVDKRPIQDIQKDIQTDERTLRNSVSKRCTNNTLDTLDSTSTKYNTEKEEHKQQDTPLFLVPPAVEKKEKEIWEKALQDQPEKEDATAYILQAWGLGKKTEQAVRRVAARYPAVLDGCSAKDWTRMISRACMYSYIPAQDETEAEIRRMEQFFDLQCRQYARIFAPHVPLPPLEERQFDTAKEVARLRKRLERLRITSAKNPKYLQYLEFQYSRKVAWLQNHAEASAQEYFAYVDSTHAENSYKHWNERMKEARKTVIATNPQGLSKENIAIATALTVLENARKQWDDRERYPEDDVDVYDGPILPDILFGTEEEDQEIGR